MILRQKLIITIILLTALYVCAVAEVPHIFNYQGQLTDSGGDPITGTVYLGFAIYEDSLGADLLWKENHSNVEVVDGLFTVSLGSIVTIGPTVLDGSMRWLGVVVEGDLLMPLTPIISSMYAYRSEVADTSAYANIAAKADICDEAEHADYADDTDHAIYADTAAYVTSTAANGWTVNGTITYLTNINGKVGIGVTDPQSRLHVNGDVRLTNFSSLLFGSENNSIENTSTDMVFHSEDDIFLGPNDNVYISQGIGSTYVTFDGSTRQVGIGTSSPEEMLNIYNDESGGRAFLKIHSAHPTNWHEAGLRIETPQNRWHLRMDDDMNNNMPAGALSLLSQNSQVETMTWTENGFVGIGTTNPANKLHVYGSAQIDDSIVTSNIVVLGDVLVTDYVDIDGNLNVDDSLYAGAVQADLIGRENITDEPGLSSTYNFGPIDLTNSFDSVCSVSIEVPDPGYILLVGNLSASINHGSSYTSVRFGISTSRTSVSLEHDYYIYLGTDVSDGSYTYPASMHRIYSFVSPGTYTFFLNARYTGDGSVSVSRNYLTALYIPTLYGNIHFTGGPKTNDTGDFDLPSESNHISTKTVNSEDLADRLNDLQSEIKELKQLLETNPE